MKCVNIHSDKNTGLLISALVFLAVGLAHLIRILTHFQLIVNGGDVPVWLNWVMLGIAWSLSFWLLSLRSE